MIIVYVCFSSLTLDNEQFVNTPWHAMAFKTPSQSFFQCVFVVVVLPVWLEVMCGRDCDGHEVFV